ncbi:unnamed protein product [Linum tenue]|uniref:Uncharacterized protein n=1 Tax=Linum tenue TaxID=586396 RepID=A0AAV0QQ76_9ROSI|nr:unnamed protein product [Linum tenue]
MTSSSGGDGDPAREQVATCSCLDRRMTVAAAAMTTWTVEFGGEAWGFEEAGAGGSKCWDRVGALGGRGGRWRTALSCNEWRWSENDDPAVAVAGRWSFVGWGSPAVLG